MALKTQKAKTFMAMVVFAMTCILALTAEAATFTDDFSAGINPAHYTVTAGAYTIDGTQGDVRMSKPYGPGAWAQLFFNHDVSGDFDISVDYRDAILAGDHNQIQLNLSFGGQYIADRRENWDGSRYSVWIDPPANSYGVTGTADTAGKLRVTRIGSTITCYANDTQIYQGDFNSSPVTDLWLSLQNNGTEDALSVTFDNFSITADGIDCNPSGMLSWWKAEDNANDSIGTNHGTLQNGATYAAGQVGQAFSLDGVDDYVELPAGFTDFTSGFTVGLWANPTASGDWARFLELGNGSQADNILFLRRLGTNQLAFQVYNGSTLTGTAYAENAITNNEWHYYAATMDATGHVQLYKDGLPLVMAADSSSVTVPQNVTRSINSIGKSSWPGDAYYTGKIDEVEIYNRALTAGEIATLYTSGATGVCGIDSTPDAFSFTAQTNMPVTTTIVSNPITVTGIIYPVAISITPNGEYSKSTDGGSTWGSWTSAEGTVGVNDQIMVRQTSSASNLTVTTATLTIGEAIGAFEVTTAASGDPNAIGLVSWWKAEGNAYDSVGGNHGTLQGGTTYAASKDGQAFNLNGVSQYLQKIDPVAIPVGNSSRTLSAWIRSDGPTDGTKYQTIVGYGTPWTNSQTFLLEWGGAGNDRHLYLTGWNIDLAGTSTLEYGQWYHVAVTYNGTTVTLYVNGSLDASADCALNTILNPDGLLIGTSPPNDGWHSYFNGRIDNVAVYNRALSASEVAKLAGVAPDAFSFTAQTGMPVSTQIISNPITVTGTSSPSTISITNGEYSISTDGGGTWSAYSSTIPATVSLNDQVKVRQTSSASNSTLTTATLTIGGVTGAFNVTTAASGDPNASGLVSWWKAENNGYDSVGGNHGTPQAGATYAAGQVGQAFSFDGVDDYVNVPYSSSLDLQGSITITAWINSSNNSSQNRGIAGKAGGYQIFILAGGHLDLGFYNGTWTHLQSSITIPENEWVYVVGTFNATDGTMQLYINGVPDTNLITAQRMSANANGVKIGGFGSDGAPFSGIIDEVKIFNRALSALEISTLAGTKPDAFSFTAQTDMPLSTSITSNPITVTGTSSPSAISITNGEYSISTDGGGTWSAYSSTIPATVSLNSQVKVRQTSSASNSTLTTATLTIGGVTGAFNVTTAASGDPNAIGLVAWWKAENNAYDSVGTNNGTLQNGATYAAGKVGQSFSLDGTNNYVEIPHDASLSVDPSSPMSFVTWVYRTSTSGTQHIFSKRTDCSYFNYQLALDTLSHNGLCFGGNATQSCTTGGTSDLPLNTWTHIAGTSDGSTLKLFINGKLAATVAGTIGAENTAPLKIGAAGTCGTYLFGGLIDEVEFFNRALTDLEISTLAGTKPDTFTFVDQTNIVPNTVVTSTPDITVNGITNAAAISIASCTGTNCEYKINSNAWTSTAGTVNNSDTVTVRQTSSAGYSTQTDLVLTIGGVTDTFSVTTMAIPQHTLAVNKSGTGAGDVTGGGTYNYGTTHQITATASTGSTFTGWSGDCDGTTSPLDVLIDGNKTCTATFTLNTHTLTVNKAGTGAGDVTGGGTYNYGTTQQITATASTGSIFTGWSGSCSGTTSPLDVLIDGNKICIATFALNTYTLTINKTGAGTVTSEPAGINCGSDCAESYDYGAEVTLTAIPVNGNIFIGWSNDGCTGQEDCIVIMNDIKEISVVFQKKFPWIMFLPAITKGIRQ